MRIRGAALLHIVKGLKQRRSEALALLPPDIHPYLEDQIRVDHWYPAEHLQVLLAALVELTPPTVGDPWVWLGEYTASLDLAETYSQMVPPGDPWGMLQRLPALWRLYYDGGEVAVELETTRRAVVDLTGFPHVHPDYCRHLVGFFSEAMRLAGAREVRTELDHLDRAAGHARWKIAWNED